MPWRKVPNHSECDQGQIAIVKDDDGTVAGCHDTEGDADRQLAALYASEGRESDVDVIELGGKPNPGTDADRRLRENRRRRRATAETDGDCPPGQHRMPNSDCMPDEDMTVDITTLEITEADLPEGPTIRWEGILAVEGVETGDGREFAPGSLTWPDPHEVVIPISWQRESEPQHGRSVVVGRIDTIERRGDQIWGEGFIQEDAEVTAQIRNRMAGGISVDVDSVKDMDIELVFPEDDTSRIEESDDIITLFGPPPEKIVYHQGRLRGATLVALPAFVEAMIRLVDEGNEAIVASGIPIHPPHDWFRTPGLDGPTPWHVDDTGRVFGHLALWSSCHTTFPDRCITPPRERDFPYFMRGELKTSDEQLIGVGQVTLGTGHAHTRLGARPAAEHYDNTGAAVCDITVGEDRYGIWVAGAVRSTITDVQLRELRGAALSGDWRRIGGKLRLVAVLAVNVPGFPIPKMRAQVDDDWSALVAAGIVTDNRAARVRTAMATVTDDGTIRVRRVTLAAVGTHTTATREGTWSIGPNEKRLSTPMPSATARKFYAWVSPDADSEVQKTDGKFGHHFVSGDGTPGAASLTACSSGIGVLNGGRGGTSIPDADRRGVYNHLATHLRAGGQEPPPLQ